VFTITATKNIYSENISFMLLVFQLLDIHIVAPMVAGFMADSTQQISNWIKMEIRNLHVIR
jgi:hypothetical protein